MKTKLAIFFTLFYFATFAQQIYFNNRYDYFNRCDGSIGILQIDSNYFVAGRSDTNQNCSTGRVTITKLSSTGNILFKKNYRKSGTDDYPGFGSFIRTNDSAFALAGTADSAGYYFPFLMKFNSNGDSLWWKQYGDTSYQSILSQCKQTSDKGFILAGTTDTTGDVNFLLIKTDSIGNIQWQKNYGNSAYSEEAFTLDTTSDGGFVIGGWRLIGANKTSYIVKTDSLGNFLWERAMSNDVSACVSACPGGGCIVACSWTDSAQSWMLFDRLYVLKYNAIGTVVWQQKYGQPRLFNHPWQVTPLINGNFSISGNTSDTLSNVNNHVVGFIRVIDGNGNNLWYHEYEKLTAQNSDNYLRDVKQTSDGGYVACGFIIPSLPDTGNEDMWVIKLDSLGCPFLGCNPTGFYEIQKDNVILNVFPNPTSGIVNFDFILPDGASSASAKIYNIQGELVSTFFFEGREGMIKKDFSDFPNGLFFYSIIVNNNSVGSGKFIILR